MSKGKPITQEVFDQIKKLTQSGVFAHKEVAAMTGRPVETVKKISRFETLEEMRAVQNAALKLSHQRRQERAKKEQEAKQALEEELTKEEKKPIGDCFKAPEPDEDINLRLDILAEKLDTVIEVLKQIRIAQTGADNLATNNLTTIYGNSTKPF